MLIQFYKQEITTKYTEIYLFEENTKYISSNVLKI